MDALTKYISTSVSAIKPDITKTEISDNAYAICELISELTKEIAFRVRKL